MIFLTVLIVATAIAAITLGSRAHRQTVARWGLGVALAIAGLSHFVNPTPFEQHLPDWVPAPGVLAAISGATEIVLGLALVTA